MTRDTGIRSLLQGVVDPDEIREQEKAKAAIMQRLNVTDTPTVLPAAVDRLSDINSITFKPDFFKTPLSKKEIEEKKFKDHMEKEYGDEAIKRDVLKEIYKNKKAGKDPYHNMSQSSIMVAEIVKDRAQEQLKKIKSKDVSIQQQVINYSPHKVKPIVNGPAKNQKKFRGLKGGITVDAEHPDGFRINDDKDLYEVFGKDMNRYAQELAYKYDDIPIKETVKKFDSMDPSSFPSDPKQQAALSSYGKAFDRLTPLQKKQIDNNNNKKKLFQNILPLKNK